MIDKEEIIGRIEAGHTYMGSLALKADRTAKRYRDMGGQQSTRATDPETHDQAVGRVNYPAINIRQKVAAIVFSAPEFAIDADPEHEELVRADLTRIWRAGHLLRTVKHAYQSRLLTGLGFCAYLWADGRFELEHVNPSDLSVDPHTQDSTWNSLRWAARRIMLPAWVAEQRWPGISTEAGKGEGKPKSDRSDAIAVWTYWDRDVEVERFGERILSSRKNPYGEVPLRVLQGDINPVNEWAMGDYDEVTGAAELMKRLQDIISNAAQHGGGYAWADGSALSPESKEALLSGRHDQVVITEGFPGEKVMGWTEAMPLNSALLETLQMMGAGLDADQGVSGPQRGVVTQSPKFATEVMVTQSSSGARSNVARQEVELFMSAIAERQIALTAMFADPEEIGVDLWEAYAAVRGVRTVEESAAWRDPAMDQQASMQLLQVVTQAMPLFMQLVQAGVSTDVPNLTAYLNDVLRAFRRRQVEAYWLRAEPTAAAPTQGELGPEPVEPGVETVNA